MNILKQAGLVIGGMVAMLIIVVVLTFNARLATMEKNVKAIADFINGRSKAVQTMPLAAVQSTGQQGGTTAGVVNKK